MTRAAQSALTFPIDITNGRIRVREVRSELVDLVRDDDAEPMPSAFTGGSMVRILCAMYGAHNRPSESLYALFYDSRRNLISTAEVFRGTISSALCSPRDIVKLALDLNACGVAVGHNHPSGITSPSGDDLLFTHKLSQALALFNIELLNHVVIGRDPHHFFEIPV